MLSDPAQSSPVRSTALPHPAIDHLERVLAVSFSEANAVLPLRNGDEIFASMLAAIDAAVQSVDFLTFVYWSGEVADTFADALVGASKR